MLTSGAGTEKRKRRRPRKKRRDAATLAVAVNLSIGDVEALTGLPHNRVYNEINSGRLLTFLLGRRRYTTRRALEAWLAQREREAAHA
jgi:hypothetical protein